jgi:poly(3-hydroxyalkanoate) depolymerase
VRRRRYRTRPVTAVANRDAARPHPVARIRRIRVLGQDVRVSIRPGTVPGRAPLVLCNGIGASLDLLEPFVDALPAELEVVSFDVPGVGGSPMPRVPYNLALLAAFLGRLLDRLGYGRVDVLGMSWGGGLAQQFAFQNPRRCRRLVLVSTATGLLMVPAGPNVLLRMATPRRYRDPNYAARIAPYVYGGAARRHPEVASRLMSAERVGARGGYLLQLLAGFGWTSLPLLPLIRQPTLILTGNDDPIIRLVNARMMFRLLPHAQLHVFDDGHLGILTKADELAPLTGRFLMADVAPFG